MQNLNDFHLLMGKAFKEAWSGVKLELPPKPNYLFIYFLLKDATKSSLKSNTLDGFQARASCQASTSLTWILAQTLTMPLPNLPVCIS